LALNEHLRPNNQIIPLGQIILFDRKEYLLLDKPNFFMDDPTGLSLPLAWKLPRANDRTLKEQREEWTILFPFLA
jgi:hypothetical protein